MAAWLDEQRRILPSPSAWQATVTELRSEHGHAGAVAAARPRRVTLAEVRKLSTKLARAAQRRAAEAAARRAQLDAAKPNPLEVTATPAARELARADYAAAIERRRREHRDAALDASLRQAHAHRASASRRPRRDVEPGRGASAVRSGRGVCAHRGGGPVLC